MTVIGLEVPVTDWPPFPGVVASVAVTTYEVTGKAGDVGAVNDTVDCPFPTVARTAVGAPASPGTTVTGAESGLPRRPTNAWTTSV